MRTSETMTRMKSWLLSALFILQAIHAGYACAHEVLKVGGTGGALGTMKVMATSFEKVNPEIDVRVLPSMGSSGGIKAVSEGAVQVGLSSRHLREEERKAGLSFVPFARTPFVIVVRNDVSATNVRTSDLVKLLNGDMDKWPDGRRVRLILRPESDADTEYVKKISPLVARALKKAYGRPGVRIAMTDQECLQIVEKTPGAIGFSSLAQVVSEKSGVKVLSYNGIVPSLKTLGQGSYRLVKEFHIVTKAKQTPSVEKFVQFVFSSKGMKIIEKSGSIPLKKGMP